MDLSPNSAHLKRKIQDAADSIRRKYKALKAIKSYEDETISKNNETIAGTTETNFEKY